MAKRTQISFECSEDLRQQVQEVLSWQTDPPAVAELLRNLLLNYIANMRSARAEGDPRVNRPREEPRPKARSRERRSKPERAGKTTKGGRNGK